MFCAEEYKKLLAKSETISDMEAVPLPLVRDDQNYIFISYSHQDYKQVYSDLADMYEARKPLYSRFCDIVINNNATPNVAAQAIAEAYMGEKYEIIDY